MRKYIKLYEAYDTNHINAALGFLENNKDAVITKYGDKSWKVASAILVDLRDNGDKGRDYSQVPEIGKADEVYKKALTVVIALQSANPNIFTSNATLGNSIKTSFKREMNGQEFVLGTQPEEEA